MVYKFSILGFFVLSFAVIELFFMSFVVSANESHPVIAFFKFIILMLMAYEIKNEWINRMGKEQDEIMEQKFEFEDLESIFMVIVGTIISFALNNEFGLQAVAASSIVGFLASIVIPKHQIALYCGSFAGMASIEVFSRYESVLLSGLITGITLVFTKHVFKGFGGKLGISAFVGTTISAAIMDKIPRGSIELSIKVSDWIILYFILGAAITFMIDEKKKIGTVGSSSIVGIIGALLLPIIHGNEGDLYAIAAFCGTFIGMTSLQRIKKRRYMIAAGAFGSMIFVYTNSIYVGLGGKLGAIAFGSTIAITGLMDFSRKVLQIRNEKL